MGQAWGVLLRGIGALLAAFYAVIPSYGAAIVAMTVLVNLVMLPLTIKQLRSTRAMQRIQPQVKELRSQWGKDRARLNEEVMDLYRSEGVHPAGGCLPSLLQLPIWMALYRVLRNSVGAVPSASALHGALEAGRTWFLGVDLLTTPRAAWELGPRTVLPYLALMAALLGVGLLQQKSAASANTQIRVGSDGSPRPTPNFARFIPAFFLFIAWGMPAGLSLYWVANQSIRTVAQRFARTPDGHWAPRGPCGD